MMKELEKEPAEKITDNSGAIITSNPSEIIKHYNRVITIDGVSLGLILVTMRKSFLLSIHNVGILDQNDEISKDSMIRGFMNSNQNLTGLSLAIGDQSTCIMNSDNSLDSATLASRLSKKLNIDRPVYVANNLNLPYDSIDDSTFKSKLYLKVFQFVRDTYCSNCQV